MAEVIDLDARRRVWATVKEVCRACSHECVGVVHIDADWDRLECSACCRMESGVVRFLGSDGEWIQRLEIAKRPKSE